MVKDFFFQYKQDFHEILTTYETDLLKAINVLPVIIDILLIFLQNIQKNKIPYSL